MTSDVAYNTFVDILEDKKGHSFFITRLREMMADRKSRLILDLDALAEVYRNTHFGEPLVQRIIKQPAEYIPEFEDALADLVQQYDPHYHRRIRNRTIRLGFEGSFGRNHISVRGLKADKLNQMVRVRGIVTQMGEVIPKLDTTVHYCPATSELLTRSHRDGTSLVSDSTSSTVPLKDEDGNPIVTEIGLSRYRDTQIFVLQEMPEKTPTGQLPRFVQVIFEADLTEQSFGIKTGDRIDVIGVYRPMSRLTNQRVISGVFKARVIANNVIRLNNHQEKEWTGDDVRAIQEIAKRPDALELFGRSMASNLCGHDSIKKGLFLQMLGGVEKVLPNKTRLRGDINVLLVGDPSVGKSQLLRFCMSLHTNAISTSGRGSSGVGLTAAVVTDNLTKKRRLEAGAMVLADRGLVCIDEFEKMAICDRTAVHEVMEQQTVTIAKAGMHVSLNARCSVLAAANPLEGTWNDRESLTRNINLPDPLLSRFDLVYVIQDDQCTPEHDRRIATQVLKNVRYRSPREANLACNSNERSAGSMCSGEKRRHDCIISPEAPPEDTTSNDVFQKNMLHLYSSDDGIPKEYLTFSFLKKFIQYARERHEPELTVEAVEATSKAYSKIRQAIRTTTNKQNILCVTTRSYEALIRLTTAHAKMKLRDEATIEDAEAAIALWKASRMNDPEAEEIHGEDRTELKRSREKAHQEPREIVHQQPREIAHQEPREIAHREERFKDFKRLLREVLAKNNDIIPRESALQKVNDEMKKKYFRYPNAIPFENDAAQEYLQRMIEAKSISYGDENQTNIIQI